MSDTTRDALAQVILVNAMCPGQERIARRVADAVLAEYLVVARADIVDYSYAVRSTVAGEVWYVHEHPDRDRVTAAVEAVRNAQTAVHGISDAEVVSRPILPWTPDPTPRGG